MANAELRSLHFRNISIDAGLSDSFVLAIEKDNYGFIWVGTSEGLNRYDGYGFDTYRNHPEDPNSLSSSFINALHQDSEGNLWIGTEKGLNIYDYDSDSFRRVTALNDSLNLLSSLRIRSIHEFNNIIYLGTLEGLICLDRLTMHLSFFKLTSEQDNKMANEVLCMTHDIYGMMWLGTYDGLYRYNPIDNAFERFDARRKEEGDIANNLINTLFIPDKTPNLLYIGGPNGLMVYDVRKPGQEVFSLRASDGKELDDEIKNITQYNDNIIVLGTENGLSFYDVKSKRIKTYYCSLYDETSIPSNLIKTSLQDLENGIIWFGTDNGLTSLDLNRKAVNLTRLATDDVPNLRQRFIAHDLDVHEDELWLASREGVRMIDEKGEKNYSLESGLQHRICKSLFRDSRGTLWVGTNNGLNWYDKDSDSFKAVRSDISTSAPLKYIFSITEDSSGDIVTNISSGLLFITPNRDDKARVKSLKFKSISISELIQSDNCDIGYIEADRRGGVWFSATMDGLFHYDKKSGKIRNFKTIQGDSTSLISNRVYSIFADKADNIWVGTDLGLCCFLAEKGHFIRFDIPELRQSIRIINADKDGRMWITTNSKLIMFNPLTQEKIVCDLKADLGLEEVMYNSSYLTHEGEMWFGCSSGYVNFNPQEITINSSIAPLTISSFSLWNKKISPGKAYNKRVILPKSILETEEIVLKHDEKSIEIAFSLLNYSSTSNKYMYMLEGYDKEFRTITNNTHSTSYSNLSPGDYIFRVRACNSDDIWSEDEPTLKIRILQPIWHRWWAWCIYCIMFCGAVLFALNYFRMRVRLSNELREERLERMKLEEINETKMRFFTNLSHDFKTPLSLILGPLENLMASIVDRSQLAQLRILQSNANILLRLINQIMDIRKIENGKIRLDLKRGDIVSFASKIFESFRLKAQANNIKYDYFTSISQLQIDFDSDKTEKVLFNLISNAFKFTPMGGSISLTLNMESLHDREFVVFIVKDSGSGISEEEQRLIFERFYQSQSRSNKDATGIGVGLTIVKDFVELQGGKVFVESAIGQGSTFSFTIPIDSVKNLDYDEADEAKGIRILVVEDNEDMLEFMRLSLKDKYEVLTASNGANGYSKAKEFNPDVIISDIMMPEMDGYDLCRKVKSETRTSHIPIILLSAKNDEESRKEGYLAMADGYISKPFSVKTLLAKVEMLIEQRKMLQEKFRRELLSNPSAIRTETEDDIFINTVVKAIEDNMNNSAFGIQELCNITKWSHQQIYRKVRALTGESINEFVRTVRLKRAAQLLSKKGSRVSTVMYDVGFNSHSYFTKCFKDKYGVSPKEYADSKMTC